MYEYLPSATNWALHAAAAGVILFAFGWAVVRRISDPARRQQLAGWVIHAALLVAVLSAMPAWLLVPLPVDPITVENESVADPMPPQPIAKRDVPPESLPAERWVIVVPAVAEFPPPPEQHPDKVPEATTVSAESLTPAPGADSNPIPVRSPAMVDAPLPPLNPWPGIIRLVMLAYGVGVAIGAVPLVLGTIALMRLRRHSKPAPARLQTIFDELTDGLHVQLRVASHLGTPVCFGLIRPVVVLPVELADAADDELRWVFAHELDHLRRGDPWTNWCVGLAKAVYFAVPWFWCVRRDLLLTQEYLADAAAAAVGRVEDYASFLVRLSERPAGRRHPVGANAVRAGKSELYRRVTMLLSANGRSAPRTSRRWSAAVVCTTIGLAVVLSGIGFARQDVAPRKAKTVEAPLVVPNPGEMDDPPLLIDPINPGFAVRGGHVVIPVLGVAQFQALPVRTAGRLLVPNAPFQPGVDPLIQPLIPGPAVIPFQNEDVLPPLFNPADPEILQLQAKIARLGEVLLDEQAGNKDDREEKIKALKAEIDKLNKDLEKLKEVPPLPGIGSKRVVVGGFPNPGGNTWVQVAPGQVGFSQTVETRLGILVDRVSPVLADQLDLPKGQGVVITGVLKEQAADKAGLKANDILLEFAGKPVADAGEFQKAVNAVKVGDKVDVLVLRKGKKETIKGVEVPEAKRILIPVELGAIQPLQPLNIVPPVPPGALVPAIPGKPLAVPFPPKPALIPAPGGQGRSMQVEVYKDVFRIQANEDGVQYTIDGINKDGKPEPTAIVINTKGEAIKAQSVDKVPEKHKDRVKQLLDSVKFAK